MKDLKFLKKSKFVYLWTSQVLSQLAINIMNFLLLIRLYEKTGSSIATSFLWVAYALPAILIGPIAAASVDLFDRRKMLITANLMQSMAIFGYAFLHETNFFLLYGIAVTYSFFNQCRSSLSSFFGKEKISSAGQWIVFPDTAGCPSGGIWFCRIVKSHIGF
jgi:MFS family permease